MLRSIFLGVLIFLIPLSLTAQPYERVLTFGSENFKHDFPVRSVLFSADGKFVSCQEKDIFLWDATTATKVRTISEIKYGVVAMAYSPDGKTLAIEDSC